MTRLNRTKGNQCLGYALEKGETSLDTFKRRVLLVYLDMVESTYLKTQLIRGGRGSTKNEIFLAFYHLFREIERQLNRCGLEMLARAGDSILFQAVLEPPHESLRNLLPSLRKLPQSINRAIQREPPLRILKSHKVEFRAGLHSGRILLDSCSPRSPNCIDPTQLVAVEIDLVTKIAQLSECDSNTLTPAISENAAAALKIQKKNRSLNITIDEDKYIESTASLYQAAANDNTYAFVDFSIFDKRIIEAICQGGRSGHLHMAGWLSTNHSAAFGAILRKSLCPKLDLRIVKLPHELVRRSRIQSKGRAIIGQPFSYAGDGPHFLVGRELEIQDPNHLMRLGQDFDYLTFSSTDSTQMLRNLGNEAAGHPSLEWLIRLTSMDSRLCERLIEKVETIDQKWDERIKNFLK